MTVAELLEGKLDCPCTKAHPCPIDSVVIGKNACESLVELCGEYKSILLVADKNTYAVGGDRVMSLVGEKISSMQVFDTGDGLLVPNEKAISDIEAKLMPETDLVIGIGSGVINDLCKQVSFTAGLRYYIVATAPSMDGYASKGAALILDGMKVTTNADVPKAIIGDVDMLKSAPMDMIRAGYGDIIGKYSCLNDWKLSALVNGEYMCEYVLEATYEEVEKTVGLVNGLLARDDDAIATLMQSLVAVGILMAYVGNSRPASGSEHHFSHYFEIVGIVRGEEYLAHGVDVCYSAIETAKIREELAAIEDISELEYSFDREGYEANIRRVYGSLADEVLALQNKLGWYGVDRVAVYREKWQEIRKLLSDCPSSSEMIALVEKIGLPYESFKKFYGEEKIRDAYFYAKDLKDRYSVLWMYYDLFCR